MGQVLRCCFRSSTPQPSVNELHHLSNSTLADSVPSRSHSMTSHTYDHTCSQGECTRTNSFQDVRAQDIKPSPPLECFIIPSFGEDPPEDVAVKLKLSDKMASKF